MAQARWRIVGDTPRDELSPDGTFSAVREIKFEVIDNGRQGSVIVPVRNYTPEEVAARVQEYADQIKAIAELGNG